MIYCAAAIIPLAKAEDSALERRFRVITRRVRSHHTEFGTGTGPQLHRGHRSPWTIIMPPPAGGR